MTWIQSLCNLHRVSNSGWCNCHLASDPGGDKYQETTPKLSVESSRWLSCTLHPILGWPWACGVAAWSPWSCTCLFLCCVHDSGCESLYLGCKCFRFIVIVRLFLLLFMKGWKHFSNLFCTLDRHALSMNTILCLYPK